MKEHLTLSIRELALLKSNPQEYYKKQLEESKSYSHKPHLGSLPHDRRTNDPDKLKERLDAIDERLKETDKQIKEIEKEMESFDGKGTAQKDIQNNIDEVQAEIDSKKEEISNLTAEYDVDMEDALGTWEEYASGVENGDLDISPSLDKIPEPPGMDEWSDEEIDDHLEAYINDSMEQVYEDIATISEPLEWFKGKTVEEVMQPELEGAFEESIQTLRNANYDINELISTSDYSGMDTGSLYNNMFGDLADKLDDIREAHRVIDADQKFIDEETERMNNSSSSDSPQYNELNRKLEKLQRERQDYLDERDRTETKRNGILDKQKE